jgi:5'-nucleotidase
MSVEEKIPYMIEWWRKAQSLILSSNLDQNKMRELICQSKMELRKGVQEFTTELLRSQTPILIFSAGLGKQNSYSLNISSIN